MLKILVASYAFITLKAFQQLNVVGYHYYLAICTALILAVAEATIFLGIIQLKSFVVILPMSVGGAAGVCTAMLIHQKWITK